MGMKQETGTARLRTMLTRGALLASCGILAAACGSTAATNGTHSSAAKGNGAGSAGTTSAAKVSLDVELSAGPGVSARHWTLRCEPAGGTLANAAVACDKLLAHPEIFSPQPVHIMCPMIMADARSYLVNGIFLGKHVHESIIDGGCSLGRWTELNQVFS
jgi:hypothetical protein